MEVFFGFFFSARARDALDVLVEPGLDLPRFWDVG
jgi:hypothetical protein